MVLHGRAEVGGEQRFSRRDVLGRHHGDAERDALVEEPLVARQLELCGARHREDRGVRSWRPGGEHLTACSSPGTSRSALARDSAATGSPSTASPRQYRDTRRELSRFGPRTVTCSPAAPRELSASISSASFQPNSSTRCGTAGFHGANWIT